MRTCSSIIVFLLVIAVVSTCVPCSAWGQRFVHPGINQTLQDLKFLKSQVQKGQHPFRAAFERLKAVTDTQFIVKPYAHVLRGPYGKPNIGGDELSKSANMAYNYALVWYITDDRKYADRAKEILNAWSPALWDFDYNDAKLLAAWTGHLLCNAAEILRYTNSGWQQKDISNFSKMLMTVYYPLMRHYYPQANGNWDGAIIHSIMAIGIFTDNHNMFNNAVDHFLHGPVNGSIFKYIYPSGQCQETMRDQAHVQLGLGEFSGAAQIAYTQGVDLFSIGNNRIALGYEYTARFLLGEKPQSYGTISERAKNIRDDYEYVYRHYSINGIELPFTKRAADSVRSTATRSVLTSLRAPTGKRFKNLAIPKPGTIGYVAGAGATISADLPASSIIVTPGQSLQKALDESAGTGRWVVAKPGVHVLPTSLKMPSKVTLVGEGLSTILFLDPGSGEREAIVNAKSDLHEVTIGNLVIECALKTETPSDPNSSRSYRGGYNRGGILFRGTKEGEMNTISFKNLTVQNATYHGVSISGASNVIFAGCDFNENGASVAPGQKLLHNLLLIHCNGVTIEDSRLDTSPFGSGVFLDHNTNVSITNCEIARNGYHGVLISESRNISVKGNLIEGNDRSGLMAEFLFLGSENIAITNNLIHFNNGYGVETYALKKSRIENNTYVGNGNSAMQQKISNEKFVVME